MAGKGKRCRGADLDTLRHLRGRKEGGPRPLTRNGCRGHRWTRFAPSARLHEPNHGQKKWTPWARGAGGRKQHRSLRRDDGALPGIGTTHRAKEIGMSDDSTHSTGQASLFVWQVSMDQEEPWRRFLQELAGPRLEGYVESRRRLGIFAESVWFAPM